MVSPPVLKLPEPGKLFEIWTDASDFAIGACLHQDGRPVAYESCKLENRWITPEREMYAIIYAIKKWEYYLRNSPKFIIHSDSSPARYFNSKPRLSPKEQLRANSLLILETTWPKLLLEAYADDRIARVWLKNGGTQGKLRHITWILNEESGVYMWRYEQRRVYIPKKLSLEVLQKYHESPWGGHAGQAQTYATIAKDVYWPEMKKDVLKHVQSCYSCQKNRPLYRAKGGILKPLPVAAGPWEFILMDFIQGLLMSHGFNAILTIVDHFSKMAYVVPTRETVSATEVATVVFDHGYKMWGLPTHILANQDSR